MQFFVFKMSKSYKSFMFRIEIDYFSIKEIFYLFISGYPSELFYRGAGMWETIYGLVTAYPIVCFVFVPVYLNLGITSVYQYLDLR